MTKHINILGSTWTVTPEEMEDNNYDGLADLSTKEIRIRMDNTNEVGDFEALVKKQTRHEVIHAFLYESGLSFNSDWAVNEELVDWIAIQFPKIAEVYEKLGCI